MAPTKVVIVGAGASARMLVKSLRASANGKPDKLHITVVQPNRFASMPYYQTLVLTKRDTLENNSTFVAVSGVDETVYGVAVACGDGILAVRPLTEDHGSADVADVQVLFDVLVGATGSAFPVLTETPGQSTKDRQKEIDQVSGALLSGKQVVIAGGGATGVELAADVLEGLPAESRKGKVTLICSTDRILRDQPLYYSERATRVLEELGATILFNERVVSHTESTMATKEEPVVHLKLKSGKSLDAEAYIAAFSRGANTLWLTTALPDGSSNLPAKLLNERGQVVVDDYLKSTAYAKLYALGAASSRTEPTIVPNLEAQAKTVAANIIKPNSTKQAPGIEHAIYQVVGHQTFSMMVPENLPMPAPVATLCCQWCGFPFNLLCPCWCCAVTCGPANPMTCGWCCGAPEGQGLAQTIMNLHAMKLFAGNTGYADTGKGAPKGEGMAR
jgi:NADH dehydrogenase FAD-containing subunit